MINKDILIARFGNAFKSKHISFDKRFVHPVRDWLIGLTVFLLIVVIGGVQSAVLFVEYRNVSTTNQASEVPVIRYNKLLVDNMTAIYGVRKEAYEARQQGKTTSAVETVVPLQVPATSTPATSTLETTEEGGDEGEVLMAI